MANAMKLPIDTVPHTRPVRFKWKQTVSGVGGTVTQDCEGYLPPSVESAVVNLIALVKQLTKDNAELWERIEAMKPKDAKNAVPIKGK